MRHANIISMMDARNPKKKPHRSNKEIEKRIENEEKLRTGVDKVKPPNWLSRRGKKIFRDTAKELIGIGIISNLDVDTFAIFCDSVDKYEKDSDEIKRLRKDFKAFEDECDDVEVILEKSIEVNKLI